MLVVKILSHIQGCIFQFFVPKRKYHTPIFCFNQCMYKMYVNIYMYSPIVNLETLDHGNYVNPRKCSSFCSKLNHK